MVKVLFMGQKPFGEKCFEYLFKKSNDNFSIAAVVSNKIFNTRKRVSIISKSYRLFSRKKELPRLAMPSGGMFYGRNSIDGLREIKNLADINDVKRRSRAFYFPPFENAYFMIDGQKFYIIPSDES